MSTPSERELHQRIDDWLALAEADALPSEEKKALDLHLAACPACRRIATEHHAMSQHLKATLEPRRPDAAFEERLLTRFREEATELEEEITSAPSSRWNLSYLMAGISRAFRVPAFRYGGAVAGLAALVVTGAVLTQEPIPEGGPVFRSRVPYGLAKKEYASDAQSYAPTPARPSSRSGDIGDLPDAGGSAAPDSPAFAPFDSSTRIATGGRFAVSAAKIAIAHPVGNVWASAASEASPASPAFAGAMAAPAPAPASDVARKIIRRSHVEMETAAFAPALAGIDAAAKAAGGLIDTQSQARGANGKISGTLVVKVLPENLDAFLDRIAALGEVKSRTTDADDISKAYADTTARIANNRAMEARLVKMIAEKDGKVGDLLQVERELGRVRSEIETMEAEIRLDDALVRYATVTIALRERDLAHSAVPDRAVLALTLIVADGNVPAAVDQAKAVLAAQAPQAEFLSARLQQDGTEGAPATTAEATLAVRAPAAQAVAAEAALRTLGPVTAFTRTDETTDADAPIRFEVRLVSEADPIQQTDLVLGLPGDAVEGKAAALRGEAASFGATVRDSGFTRSDDGRTEATLRLRLPLERYPALLARLRGEGKIVRFTEERHDTKTAEAHAGGSKQTATAEIALTLQSEAAIVPDANAPWAVLRNTLAQGAAALGWSLRMIGVALAFLAPWVAVAALVGGIVWLARKRKK
ncbi:protein of unknown function [Verrucomicrobium sp. GAS474]|uniref:DUF4349 domain-containing protein n=1 Tax=Verrucomicrobium sp. GAS474 TaxID=1882831 RepID=UPI000879B849|nr:DUF4349 domain-containing protein [Verrucomicrobium sp. GAS474]SDT91650.1 protein of unknown function [Verrucomicrobium sp. GAS474]